MESPEASEHQHGPVKKNGGPSSFDMHDEDAVFRRDRSETGGHSRGHRLRTG